jgi:hypothetical protein
VILFHHDLLGKFQLDFSILLNPYHMKRKLIITLVSACIALRASAGTIDFENTPQAYWNSGGDQNIGNYFPGVTFGPGAKILENSTSPITVGWGSYAPRSGHAVLWSEHDSIETGFADINVTFTNAVNSFSFWVDTYYPVWVTAYDANNTEYYASVTGWPGIYQEISITHASPDIARLLIRGYNSPWVIDDFTFSDPPTSGVPDSGATIAMLGGALLCFAPLRRRRVGQGTAGW